MANGIGNAVGVRHTETSLIVWSAFAGGDAGQTSSGAKAASPPPEPIFNSDHFYNAGDKGCAFGPLDEIAELMRGMASGQTLEIHATDPTVASDLSAWCRMTGHTLVEHQGAHYLVKHN